jgi:hypothetical protein
MFDEECSSLLAHHRHEPLIPLHGGEPVIRFWERIEGGIDFGSAQRVVEEVRLPDRDDLVAVAVDEQEGRHTATMTKLNLRDEDR